MNVTTPEFSSNEDKTAASAINLIASQNSLRTVEILKKKKEKDLSIFVFIRFEDFLLIV